MTICPWCGTNYAAFQPNCKNCGGPMPFEDRSTVFADRAGPLLVPPAAPRSISSSYTWRVLSADGWWIAALVLAILGVVFSLVGIGLVLGVVTALVGLPFVAVGIPLLAAAGGIFLMRWQRAQKIVEVLREGQATLGQIAEVQENPSVRVNGRHPWVVCYRFQALGQAYTGKVSTFNPPGPQLQTGNEIYVLYLASAPQWNAIYPHP